MFKWPWQRTKKEWEELILPLPNDRRRIKVELMKIDKRRGDNTEMNCQERGWMKNCCSNWWVLKKERDSTHTVEKKSVFFFSFPFPSSYIKTFFLLSSLVGGASFKLYKKITLIFTFMTLIRLQNGGDLWHDCYDDE